MTLTTIEHPGYAPVQCTNPLPCPFCGEIPELAQLAHVTRSERIGRSRKYRHSRICGMRLVVDVDVRWWGMMRYRWC